MLRAVLAVALVPVALAAYVGSKSANEPAAGQVVGGSADQRSLVRDILNAVDTDRIQHVSIEKPDPAWKPLEPGDVAVRVWTVPKTDGRAKWEAVLVAVAFADRSQEEGLPRVVAMEHRGVGTRLAAPADAEPPLIRGTCAPLSESEASSLALEHGAELVELEAFEPWGLAVSLGLRVDDPARFLRDQMRGLENALHERLRECSGTFFELVDENGAFVWRAWMVRGTSLIAASSRTRPDLEGCYESGLSRPSLLGDEPPPCPA